MNSLLNDTQKKLLVRMVTYPRIALKSFIALGANIILFFVAQMIINMQFDKWLSSWIVLAIAILELVLLVVGVYTLLYYKTKERSTSYADIKMMAAEYGTSDPFARSAMRAASAEQYCDYFRVSYDKQRSYTNLFIIVPLVVMFGLYGIGLANAAKEFKQEAAMVQKAQQAVISAFGDEYEVDYMNDPIKDSGYYTYSLYLNNKENVNKRVDFDIRRSGKISYIDYEYRFNDDLTTEENLEEANKWFAEIEKVLPRVENYMETPKLAHYEYRMTDKFRHDVTRSIQRKSDDSIHVDSNNGHYYLYENCSMYGSPTIRISVFYYD